MAALGWEAAAIAQPAPTPQPTSASAPASTSASDSAPVSADEAKAQAAARFEKGMGLLRTDAWDPALAEFLESRRLYPNRSNTANAAYCLKKLQRFDEALDMYEALLRDFSASLPAETKASAQRDIVELRGLVGTINIEGGEPGAAISVDQQSRGEYPPVAPIRVAAGSHVVRLYKDGLEPFEARVVVAGGDSVSLKAKLPALRRAGRLRVVEEGGLSLDVLVEGTVVGKTPYEGQIAPGEHVVTLRGDGALGTPPAPVSVELGKTASLTLRAEELGASIRVEPTPINASVAIDSVSLGNGIWSGRLRAGKHRIEVASPGFVPSSRDVTLEADRPLVLPVALQRDPASPFWKAPPRPSHITLEAEAAFAVGSRLTSAGVSCTGACDEGPGIGGFATIHAGYELGSRLAFGVTAGYFSVGQYTSELSSKITAVGLADPNVGEVDDDVRVRGLLAGGWLGFSFFERFPLRLRLNAAILVGAAAKQRVGTFMSRKGEYEVGPVGEIHRASFFVVTPEIRVGAPLGRGFELSFGVELPILASLSRPAWDPNHAIYAGSDGYGTFDEEPLTLSGIVLFSPSLAARYEF